MLRQRIYSPSYRALVAVVALFAVLIFSSQTFANNNNNNNNNGGANNNNNNTTVAAAGVQIDAQGVLRVMLADPVLTMDRLRAAKQSMPANLMHPSKLRKVSLQRLEKAVAECRERGESPSPEMVALAGLTRIEYVFCYPDSGDIVLAGPAEGFGQDSVGRLVGVETGRSCLLLEDLIVALRAFSPSGEKTNMISVSIDPTQEGLARMQQTLQKLGSNFGSARDIPFIVNSLRESLGFNEVTIKGIAAGTHFAHVLTEADYRMKLIGIGLENPPVPMGSYVSRLTAAMTSSNALIRWYFIPDYEALAVSEDGLAMKMVGQGVKLVGEDELVAKDGTRKSSGRGANPASRGYTTEFTKKFRLISEQSPIYGQLRNLVDMSIAAAFIQDRGFYDKTGWDLGIFADEDRLPVQTLPAPRQVETAINAVVKGSRLITPIGGGVAIQARKALEDSNLKSDVEGAISKQRDASNLDSIPGGQWWWD